MAETALIVGAGTGTSASFARALAAQDVKVALAARNVNKLAALSEEINGLAIACDVAQAAQVEALFTQVDETLGGVDVVLFNPSARVRGSILDVDAEALKRAIMVSAYGGFLVGQQAARRMVEKGGGAIFFTGATASVKGYAHSASFGMGKFALRALAQSMARELGPKNIHVAHFVIDGSIDVPGRERTADNDDGLLDPDAIAATYMAVLQQHRSAWTHELDLRPWCERF